MNLGEILGSSSAVWNISVNVRDLAGDGEGGNSPAFVNYGESVSNCKFPLCPHDTLCKALAEPLSHYFSLLPTSQPPREGPDALRPGTMYPLPCSSAASLVYERRLVFN